MRLAGENTQLMIALLNAGGYLGAPGLEDLETALKEARAAEALLASDAPMNERMLPEDERELLDWQAGRAAIEAREEEVMQRDWLSRRRGS